MKCIKLNKYICINKEINMHKTKFFSPFCINKTDMYKQENKTCIYKLTKYLLLPLLSIINKGGEKQIKQ